MPCLSHSCLLLLYEYACYHSAERRCSFLLEPAHLFVSHWIQSLLRAISADFHSLHA